MFTVQPLGVSCSGSGAWNCHQVASPLSTTRGREPGWGEGGRRGRLSKETSHRQETESLGPRGGSRTCGARYQDPRGKCGSDWGRWIKFEKKFQSEKAAGSVSKSTQFEYAWCLVRSKYNDDIRKGIALLEELLPKGSKEEQRDYVFYLAVGNYRLKEYEKALKYVRGLLQTEPQNNQAKELERLIDKAMKKDGLVGMAIVGGMALGVAGLAGLIGFAVSKSKS
ncbi:mitochondrial fission 1 protein isoform 1-T1 [Molossus nigricans]